jgi:acyl CoA:acetate/3-ketoacid CoA transferase alpha subunit
VAKIEVLTGQGTPPRVALMQVLEEIEDGDAVFIIVCKADEEHNVWVRSSRFLTNQVLIAAQTLQAHAVRCIFKDSADG